MDKRPYENAHKKAVKDSKNAEQKKGNPYLLAFEEMGLKEAYSQQDLGLWDIPMERVVGTFTSTRKNSFSPHFYPLLEKESEFATKWLHLHQSHIEEGIRDPLKVLLYEGKFFVIEGHKRCSVLRSEEASRVLAQVFYVIPLEQEEEKKKRDLAFLHFTKLYKAQFFFFPRAEHYVELWQSIQKIFHYDFPDFEKAKSLPEEEAMDLRSLFQTFSKLLETEFFKINYDFLLPEEMVAYKEKVCLIFLRFLKIFGFSKYKNSSAEELKALITLSKTELFEENTEKKISFVPPLLDSYKEKEVFPKYSSFLAEKLIGKASLVAKAQDVKAAYQSTENLKNQLEQSFVPLFVKSENEQKQFHLEHLDKQALKQNLSTLTKNASDKLKILFLHNDYASQSKSVQEHEIARKHLTRNFDDCIETFCMEGIGLDKDLELGLIASLHQKVHLVFLSFEPTQSQIEDSLLKFSLENPNIKIFYLGFNTQFSSLYAYQMALFETAFLQGFLTAQSANKENACLEQILPQPLDKNQFFTLKAFAEGYHLLRPQEKLFLKKATEKNPITPCAWTENTLIFPRWTHFYQQLLFSLVAPEWKHYEQKQCPLQFWWGIKEQVLSLHPKKDASMERQFLLSLLEEKLAKGEIQIFPKHFVSEILHLKKLSEKLLENDYTLLP